MQQQQILSSSSLLFSAVVESTNSAVSVSASAEEEEEVEVHCVRRQQVRPRARATLIIHKVCQIKCRFLFYTPAQQQQQHNGSRDLLDKSKSPTFSASLSAV